MLSSADLQGIHVALITPLTANGDLDAEALDGLIQRAVAAGVVGLCPGGSTGEGPRLTAVARRQLTAEARRLAGTRPIIAAASGLALAEIIEDVSRLADAGADALLVAPPSYYPMSPEELLDYYTRVADSAEVPVVVYNIPSLTTVGIPIDTVGTLASHPRIIGLKDSSRDMEYLQAVVYRTADADFSILTGSDTMLVPSLTVGAIGAIVASANLVPQLSTRILDLLEAGDVEHALRQQRRLFDVIQACRAGSAPAGWKAAASLAFGSSPAPVAPGSQLNEEKSAMLARRLRELEVLI